MTVHRNRARRAERQILAAGVRGFFSGAGRALVGWMISFLSYRD